MSLQLDSEACKAATVAVTRQPQFLMLAAMLLLCLVRNRLG